MFDSGAFVGYVFSPLIARGALVTIYLSVLSISVGIVAGAVLAAVSQSRNPVARTVYFGYVNLVRGTPLLVQLVLIFNALPQIGVSLGPLQSAMLGLGINQSAYCAEIIRGGIVSVPAGQTEAARALGMTRRKTMVIVILPQAAKAAVPPLGNEFNGLLKATSLVSVIAVTELFRTSEELMLASFQVMEVLLAATVYYLVMTALWTVVQRFIERRLDADSGSGAGPSRPRLLRTEPAVR